MKITLSIERSLAVPHSADDARVLFDDLETTMGRFPKLAKLTPLAPNRYRWDMATVGSRIAKIAHNVSYAADYRLNAACSELRFTPVDGVGNARVTGAMRIQPSGSGALLSFSVLGELHDVPVPLMYRLIAPAFIQGKFTALVDQFLERTQTALASTAVRPKTPRRSAA